MRGAETKELTMTMIVQAGTMDVRRSLGARVMDEERAKYHAA